MPVSSAPVVDGSSCQAARLRARPEQHVSIAAKTLVPLAADVPPPSHWLCTACQTGQCACFVDQGRDYQWSQAISSVLIALERRPVPLSGYTLWQRRTQWNTFVRTCLPQVALTLPTLITTAERPSLPDPRTGTAARDTLASLDQVAHGMQTWLRAQGNRSSVPISPVMRRSRLEWLAALESLDEAQPQYDYGILLSWRIRRTDPHESELQRLAARVPHARIATAARAARAQDESLRAAYTLDLPPTQLTLRGTCSWCGSPATA